MRKSLVAWVAAAGLAGCAGDSPPPASPITAPPKRIVLVTIDTWRSDALGESGSGRVKTPHLDRFAREGTYYPKAWSSATLTAPSHATILTGLQPYHHGVRDNHGFRLATPVPTLAAALLEKGYATAAFVSAHPLARIGGLDRGFSTYDDRCAPGDPLSVAPRWRPGAETIDAASAWIRGAPERFFLWVHLYEPHDPYAPPDPYRSEYRAAPYFGEVAYTDELIGRLEAALGAAGKNDALWVITGDHGEALDDHGEATHGLFVYDATARVPLILWAPGRVPAGKREFARLVDVAPTILAIAGAASPAELDGKPLLAADTRHDGRTAYVETLYAHLNFGAASVRAASDGRIKVVDVPQPEVYDLSEDPEESRNLAGGASPPAAQALGKALAELPGTQSDPQQPANDEEIEALRSLGYIGAGGDYALGREGLDPKSFAPLYRKLNAVHQLSAARRWSEAIPVYKELLAAFPRSSVLASELGLIEMAIGRAAEAEAHLQTALDRDPENSHALLGMANLAIGRKDLGAAETRLHEVLRLDPDDVEANFDLGLLYLQSLNRPVQAIPYLRRFIELQPGDSEAPRIRQILAGIDAAPSKANRPGS